MKKKNYGTPTILQETRIVLEQNLMASVVDNLTVESTGQEVETFDFNSTEFNHTWGE